MKPTTSPRLVGICSAVGAVVLGLAYMGMAGAPYRYLGMNVAALAIGFVALAATVRFLRNVDRLPGAVTLSLGAALLATAVFGVPVEGATRWVRLGAVVLQPSLIVLPLIIVAFAERRDLAATCGLLLAALAVAIQPDRAMAGVLAAGLGVLAIARPDRWTIAALLGAAAAFAVTLVRADRLPAVPYVDQIFYTSFEVGALAGLAVLAGSLLILAPALAGRRADPGRGEVYSVFGAVWLAIVAAAALGNYPTPLVGYGGSAILGYLLSLAVFRSSAMTAANISSRSSSGANARIGTHGSDPRAFAGRAAAG